MAAWNFGANRNVIPASSSACCIAAGAEVHRGLQDVGAPDLLVTDRLPCLA
jgi:hypothetical protein